jgi:hypothetical protein
MRLVFPSVVCVSPPVPFQGVCGAFDPRENRETKMGELFVSVLKGQPGLCKYRMRKCRPGCGLPVDSGGDGPGLPQDEGIPGWVLRQKGTGQALFQVLLHCSQEADT